MNLETKLLNITAQSRLRLMKKIWTQPASPRQHETPKKLIFNELTLLRNEIYKTAISQDILSGNPLCREIAEDEGIPQIKKNICILAINGIDAGCIADLNCVNIGYVRMCIRSLKEDYPELFR